MAVPGPRNELGRDLVAFVAPQTADSFATSAGNFPLAVDAVRVINASVNGKAETQSYEDKRGTSSPQGQINLQQDCEWSMELYGDTTTAGTAPDWADIVLNQMQNITGTSTTVSGAGSTTTVIDVADASALLVNGCVEISGQLRRITAVDTVSTPDNITITPALSAAPANAVAVTAGITYQPNDSASDTQKAMTIHVANGRSMDVGVGCVLQQLTIAFGGDAAARLSVSGFGRRHSMLLTSQLSAGIDNAVTTIPVDSGFMVPQDVSATDSWYFQVDDEVLKVVGVSSNDLTSDTRGTPDGLGSGAAAHDTDDDVYPYRPTGTYAGTPIPMTLGETRIGGVEMSLEGFSLDWNTGASPRENEHGDAYKVNGWFPTTRAVTFSGTGWNYWDTVALIRAIAKNRTEMQVFSQQGNVSGSIIAVEIPTVQLSVNAPDRQSDDVTIEVSGEVRNSLSEQEVFIMVA